MLYDKHKVVFIHIPKTGGTSIEKKLGKGKEERQHNSIRQIRPISMSVHWRYIIKKKKCRKWGVSRKKMVKEMVGIKKDKKRLTKRKFENYFKFCVVRNPWNRAYSWYKNVMRDWGVEECSFRKFLLRHGDSYGLRPQLHWIKDFDGSIPLDKIVRFENLAEEMEGVLRHIGFEDTNLPHCLKSEGKSDYRSELSDESKDIIRNRYQEEIEMFGYKAYRAAP